MKKLTLLTLALAMLLSLASCAPKPTPDPVVDGEPTPESIAYLENAFTQSDLALAAQGATMFSVVGDSIYYDAHDYTTQGIALIRASLDGAESETIYEIENPPYDPMSGVYEATSLNAFTVDDDGNAWAVTTYMRMDMADPMASETAVKLIRISADGIEFAAFDVPNGNDGAPFSPRGMCADADGNVYLAAAREVLAFNADGSYAFNILDFDGGIQGPVRSADGRAVYATVHLDGSYATQKVKTIDFAAQAIGYSFDYKGTRYFTELFPGDENADFYFSDYGLIFGWSFADNDAAIAIDFFASDIEGTAIGGIAPVGGGGFVATKTDPSGEATGFTRLTPNPTATASDKVTLTLGTIYADIFTSAAILEFNRNSATARISIIDYNVYNTQDDYTIGSTKLALDIINGNAPDILAFAFGYGDDFANYAQKGALVDLYEFLDADAELSRTDFFENILKLGEYDGELNILIPSYNIATRVGKTSIFGSSTELTTERLGEIFDKYPNANIDYDMNSASWVVEVVSANMNYFVDKSAGITRFDSAEFMELLEFSKLLPRNGVDWGSITAENVDEFISNLTTAYAQDRSLLFRPQMRDVGVVREAKFRYGEDVTFTGTPGYGGNSGNLLIPYSMLSISESSANKEIAWEFIKMVLSDETFEAANSGYALPIRISSFEAAAAAEMVPLTERDFSRGVTVLDVIGINNLPRVVMSPDELDMTDPYIINYALTAEDVAMARAVIESVDAIVSTDMQVGAIISEELDAFYAGAKTAEETARIIQSRVGLYVAENS